MKTCYRCKTEKPLSDFHAGPRIYLCRECSRLRDRKDRKRDGTKKHVQNDKDRARNRILKKKYYDPKKAKARLAVRRAIQQGVLVPPTICESCRTPGKTVFCDGKRAIQAHHYLGYDRPLDVQWLCHGCHYKADRAAMVRTPKESNE